MPPALEAWSLNHWTTSEVPGRVSRHVSRWRQTYFSLFKGGKLEKEMATHSSILAWRIPRTKEPGGLQSMGSQRVGHNWATNTHTHKGGRQVLGNGSKLGCCWTHRNWTRYGEKNPVMLHCTGEKGTACEGQSKGGLKDSRGELRVHAALLLGQWSLWVTLLIIKQWRFLPCPQ